VENNKNDYPWLTCGHNRGSPTARVYREAEERRASPQQAAQATCSSDGSVLKLALMGWLPAMNDNLSDDIALLKQHLTGHQAQMNRLRRMNFGSRCERWRSVSRKLRRSSPPCRKTAMRAPVAWTTRRCRARWTRPAHANRSLNPCRAMKTA